MDFTEVIQGVSTVGFPIVMAFLVFFSYRDTNSKTKEEVSKLADAVNNNTLVMQKVLEKMGD